MKNIHLLSENAANTLVAMACKDVEMFPEIRLGQALWNILPNYITNVFNGTPYDFFYWTDEDKVLTSFYKNFVKK